MFFGEDQHLRVSQHPDISSIHQHLSFAMVLPCFHHVLTVFFPWCSPYFTLDSRLHPSSPWSQATVSACGPAARCGRLAVPGGPVGAWESGPCDELWGDGDATLCCGFVFNIPMEHHENHEFCFLDKSTIFRLGHVQEQTVNVYQRVS